jgi:hypothetical protein
MNRELQKLLQEKWFLVAADFIAVLGVLLIGFDPKDGLQAFLAVLGILGASLIVVIPVLKDGGGKAERQAEQARLRAALADEIDRLRDDIRATAEAGNRRIGEVELDARRQGEQAAAAATAVAQRASAEINALKATVAELEKRLAAAQQSAVAGGEAKEALEELAAKVDGLAETVRTSLATSEETAEAVAELKAAAPVVTADDLKAVRDDAKKSAQKAAQALDKLAGQVDDLAAALKEVQARPVTVAPVVEAAPVKEAPAEVSPDDEEEAEDVAEEVAIEETDDEEAEEAAPAVAAESSASEGVAGTALTINLMIGIGNKPFVRGTGPGLSADKGVPMTFLGIGRWQWVCPQAEAPATVEIWKNDQSPMGEPIHLSGGEPVEVDEGHFTGS